MLATGTIDARVSGAVSELRSKYGAPIKEEPARVNWAGHGIRRTYSWHGFTIVTDAITPSGPVVRIEYQKEDGDSIQPDEAVRLLTENASHGTTWKPDGRFYSHPTYRRSDGTTALLLTLSCKKALIIRSPEYTRQAEASLKRRLVEMRQRAGNARFQGTAERSQTRHWWQS